MGKTERVTVRQSSEAFGKISGLLARAVRTWKYGALFRPGFLYLTATYSTSGLLPCGVRKIVSSWR